MKKDYLLIITADENDADYVTEENSIDDTFNFERLEKVANAIKESKQRHNWDENPGRDNKCPEELYKNILTEEEIDWFDELIPHNENGIHTIKSITSYEISSFKNYLK